MGDNRPYGPQARQSSGRDTLQWQELRNLLTGPEQRQLARILKRLDDPVRRAEELHQTLPDALSLGGSENHRIVRALQPVIDTAMKRSARRNPKVIADAIFPTLGPAIRKAISATLMGMVQSLNHILNQSFSLQGLKWRFEALRTHKNFAEVVLLHTLVYRVEQIYLIHGHTGIMLQHADSLQIDGKDPDLVSGMLTAIQDFVRDSFDTDTGQIIDTLRMDGDHSVWIEHGADVLLAVVIRGTPPVELRGRFRDLLDEVHARFGPTLEAFDGDTTPFAMIKPDLENALAFQVRSEDKQPISPLLWIMLAAGLFLAALFSWKAYNTHRHWQHLVAQLRDRQGVVITLAEKRGGVYHIAGLKDPQAKGIEQIVAGTKLDPQKLQIRWEPFLAMDPASILRRAREILQPPETAGLELSDGILVVTGTASHQWIKRLRRQSPAIAGLRGYNDAQLQDQELVRLVAARADLERQSILFNRGEDLLLDSQDTALSTAIKSIRVIQRLSRAMGITVRLSIIGQTDPSGTRAFNLELSRRRALTVRSYLIHHGIDPIHLDAIGAGVMNPADTPRMNDNREAYRSVRFRTFLETE